MDIQPKQPISDDQELAKVLAGITASSDQTASDDFADDLKKAKKATTDDSTDGTDDTASQAAAVPLPEPSISTIPDPIVSPSMAMPSPGAPAVSGNLETIKHDALKELRPLVDKLNIAADEKFDTYLLLIRSTDDSSLIGPAFEAARAISDEATKAQALLDIVKEIDYLSNPQR